MTVHGQEAFSPRRLCIPDDQRLARIKYYRCLHAVKNHLLCLQLSQQDVVTGCQREETPSFRPGHGELRTRAIIWH